MNKFLFKISGLFSLLGLGILFFAFTPSGGEELGDTYLDTRGCALSVSFIESVDSRVNILEGDLNSLHAFDRLDMRRVSENYQINHCYDRNHYKSAEKVLLNSNKIRQSWQDDVSRIVIDPSGTSLFNSRGKLLRKTNLNGTQKKFQDAQASALAKQAKQGKAPFPVIITRENINRASKNVSIIEGRNGELSVKQNFVLKNSGVQVEKLTEYKQIGRDTYLPSRVQTSKQITSPFSGVCMEKVEVKTFSDYIINGAKVK